MKNQLILFISIFQIAVGAVAIISFFVIMIGGENVVGRFIPAVILSAVFVILGIAGVVDYKSEN